MEGQTEGNTTRLIYMQARETPKLQRSDPKKIIVNDLTKSIYLDIKQSTQGHSNQHIL